MYSRTWIDCRQLELTEHWISLTAGEYEKYRDGIRAYFDSKPFTTLDRIGYLTRSTRMILRHRGGLKNRLLRS